MRYLCEKMVSRRTVLEILGGFGVDAATGLNTTSKIIDGLADLTVGTAEAEPKGNLAARTERTPDNFEKGRTAPNLDSYRAQVASLDDQIKSAESSGNKDRKADAMYKKTSLAYDTALTLRNSLIFRESIAYGNEGIRFIDATHARPNLKDDILIYVARSSGRVGDLQGMFGSYLSILGMQSTDKVFNAMEDLGNVNYNDSALRVAKKAIHALKPDQQKLARARIIEGLAARYLQSRPGSESAEAKKIGSMTTAFELDSDLSAMRKILKESVDTYAGKMDPLYGDGADAKIRLRDMPRRFAHLGDGNMVVAQINANIGSYKFK